MFEDIRAKEKLTPKKSVSFSALRHTGEYAYLSDALPILRYFFSNADNRRFLVRYKPAIITPVESKRSESGSGVKVMGG